MKQPEPLFPSSFVSRLCPQRFEAEGRRVVNVALGRGGNGMLRGQLERCFNRLPVRAAQKLRGRLRSQSNTRMISSEWELFLFDYLASKNWCVTYEPDGMREPPDFHCALPDGQQAYVEVRTAFDSKADDDLASKEAELRARLDAEVPCRFVMDVEWGRHISGLSGDDVHAFMAAVRDWVSDCARAEGDVRWFAAPDGCHIARVCVADPREGTARPGRVGLSLRWLQAGHTRQRLEGMVSDKAARLRAAAPLPVIVALCLETRSHRHDVWWLELCYGTPWVANDPRRQRGEFPFDRDGLFTDLDETGTPKRRQLSALLVCTRRPGPSGYAVGIHVCHNPHAVSPVPPEWFADRPQFLANGVPAWRPEAADLFVPGAEG